MATLQKAQNDFNELKALFTATAKLDKTLKLAIQDFPEDANLIYTSQNGVNHKYTIAEKDGVYDIVTKVTVSKVAI